MVHTSTAFAQYTFSGKVVDKQTSEPIIGAIVNIQNNKHQRVVTDNEGRFTLKGNRPSKLSIRYIGYKPLVANADSAAVYQLVPDMQALGEVVVTATEGKGLSTSSTIKRHAMDHLQPSTFADLLELLPGGRATNGSLTTPNTISLREVPIASSDYNTSSLGTQFVIDGAPISTNANMQRLSGAIDRTSTSRDFTNAGVDMRSISTDDIQEVEIVRGIPSVKYGDLTSGLVNIKRKRGGNNLTGRFKADMSSKLFYVGKGFEWTPKQFSLNLSADYLDAQADPRNVLENYKRLTFSARANKQWTLKNHQLSTALNLDYSGSFDDDKLDEELNYGGVDKYKSRYSRYATSFNAALTSTKDSHWLRSAELSASFAYEKDILERARLVQLNNETPAAVTDRTGESDAVFIYPYTYTGSQTVDGRPLNFFVSTNATLSLPSQRVNNALLVGADFQIDKNLGDGQIFDKFYPLYPETFTRPRKYSTVPASHELSFYAEETAGMNLGQHRLRAEMGARLQIMPGLDPKFAMSGHYYVDPRINVSWTLPTIQLAHRDLTFQLSAGWGRHTKFPTIDQLYPENEYIDLVEFAFFHEQRENRRLRLQTYVVDPTNPNLAPARNTKWEVRGDITYAGNRLSVTYFQEDMTSGFRNLRLYEPYSYKVYSMRGMTQADFLANPNIDALPTIARSTLRAHNELGNGSRILKRGIEYTFSSVRMPLFNTRLTINGAWFKTRYSNSLPVQEKPSKIVNGRALNVVGIYQDDEGYIREMFNTNFTLDSDIPRLKLGVSLSAQCLWFTASQSMPKEALPQSYIDANGNVLPYTAQDLEDDALRYLQRTLSDKAFERMTVPFSMNLNLKATKKLFNDRLMIALFVNKLWDAYPDYKRNDVTIRRYVTPYFGLETSIKL